MSDAFRDAQGLPIRSLAGLNGLPQAERDAACLDLLPDELLARFHIDRRRPVDAEGRPLFTVEGPPGVGSLEVRLQHRIGARDPVLYVHLGDTPNNQMIVLLLVVNDPDSPRFDVDRDWKGERTKFGTLSRNLEAERAALQAGLAPGQVRRGLKMSRALLTAFEVFVARLGHELFFLEPLGYHAAILFERYGCAYSQGRRKMTWIHQEFQPGGALFERLDGSTPFRMPGAEQSVRGRSWAIHDGVLGEPFDDVHMYKRVGEHAGVCTFPDAAW
jgi:hypothetical protein